MASRERQRESHTEPAATAVRYWQLYEDLPAGGSALAFPCRWDKQSGKWTKIDLDPEKLPKIYDRMKGKGAKIDDFVQTVWMPGSRHWETIAASSAGGMYRGVTTEDIDKGSSGTVTRFTDGTDEDSGETDEVNNDYVDIGTGKIIHYSILGGVAHVMAAPCPPK